MLKRPLQFLKRFQKDEKGTILILVGLSIIFLTAIGGAGVDLGMQQLLRVKLQAATDAAGTSTGGLLTHNRLPSTLLRTQAVQRYFNLNFPAQFAGIPRPAIGSGLNVSITADEIIVNATANYRTRFVNNFGYNNMVTASSTKIGFLNQHTQTDYDVMMLLDRSGSMNVSKMTAMKNAANRLIGKFLNNDDQDNRMRGVSWESSISSQIPFTDVKAQMLDFIAAIPNPGSGGTRSDNPLANAVAVGNLSGGMGWRTGAVVRNVILMTDGVNTSAATTNATSLVHCNTLKNVQNVTLYTIAFGSEAQQAAVKQFLGDCATGTYPANQGVYFFPAATNADLEAAFDTIGNTIRQVRISQ